LFCELTRVTFGPQLLPSQIVPRRSYQPAENNWLSQQLYLGQHVMEFDMQNRSIQIDRVHSRAISTEVGERLRVMLEKEQPAGRSLQTLISRLPELDEDSPPIVPK
jgi:hypothetical protein